MSARFVQLCVAGKYGSCVYALDEEGGVWHFYEYSASEVWRNHWHRLSDAREHPVPPPPPPPTVEQEAAREVEEMLT